MKKLTAMTLMVLTLSTISPFMPAAHAASLQDQLVQALVQNANPRVQEVLNFRNELSANHKESVWNSMAQAVLRKSGNQNVINVLTSGNPGQAIQDALRQETERRVEVKLAPYEKEIGMIANLLGWKQKLSPAIVRNSDSLTGAPKNYRRVLDMTATAYAPGPSDNGKWNNKTYMGGLVQKGVVAVDPRVIPMGTKLWVEGYGEALAVDQGSAIKGNRIDLAFNNRAQALDYGMKNVKVYEMN